MNNDVKLKTLQKFFYKQGITNREALYNVANDENSNITTRDVRAFLKNQEINQLFKPYSKNRQFRRIEVSKTGSFIQVDLADLSKYRSPQNKNQTYIIFGVDLASKMLYGVPIPAKNPTYIIAGLKDIIRQSEHKYNRKISVFQSDNGSEFRNQEVNDFLSTQGIKQVFSHPYTPQSQGSVERNIGSFKRQLYKYFRNFNTTIWIDFLPRYLNNYNNTPHKVLKNGRSPNEFVEGDPITKSKKNVVREIKPKFNEGDNVRILNRRIIKEHKTTEPHWSNELYKVIKVITPKQQIGVFKYKLNNNKIYLKEDLQKVNDIQKNPYKRQELRLTAPRTLRQKDTSIPTTRSATKSSNTRVMGIYEVERIVKKVGDKYEIKWKGYPSSQNTLEPAKHLNSNLIVEFERKQKK